VKETPTFTISAADLDRDWGLLLSARERIMKEHAAYYGQWTLEQLAEQLDILREKHQRMERMR
jgi:hypothetical protein